MTAAPAPMPPAPRAPGARRPGLVPSSTPPARQPCAHTWTVWRERQELRGKTIARYCLDCPAEEHKRRR